MKSQNTAVILAPASEQDIYEAAAAGEPCEVVARIVQRATYWGTSVEDAYVAWVGGEADFMAAYRKEELLAWRYA